jgi:Ca2+-binding EF-hand superfamily protein
MDLSQTEKAYFQKLFNLYDSDKGGTIGFTELRNLAKHLGVELDEDALFSSCRSIGIQATKKDDVDLTFEQFVRWLKSANAAGDEFAMLKAKITAAGNKALNNEQIARLKDVFDHFDADGSGSIDVDELGNVFASMGQDDISKEELENMIAGVDDDGSGQIEFPEFMMLMCGNFGGVSFEQEMHNTFEASDNVASGTISAQQLRELITETTGGIICGEELEHIIKTAMQECAGRDGLIDYMKWESLWEACREEG